MGGDRRGLGLNAGRPQCKRDFRLAGRSRSELDGGHEGTVAVTVRRSSEGNDRTVHRPVAHAAARHGTTPMTLDIPRRTFVASARPAGDGVEIRMSGGVRG